MQVVIFDESRFIESYEENNLYEFIGIDKEDLHEITREMLDYLKGDRADLVMHAEIRGEYQQVFEEREILHMVDVQYLFLGGMKIRNISAIVGIILLVVLFAVWRKKALKPLCRSYLWVMAAILVLAIILGIAMLIDFTGLFIKFHHMFFSNDLWLLDIDNDVLIQMLPEQFFNDMAMAIVYYMGAFILIPAVLSIVYLVLDRKRNGK
jgi:integral membrane protein (TIGR01906 family)